MAQVVMRIQTRSGRIYHHRMNRTEGVIVSILPSVLVGVPRTLHVQPCEVDEFVWPTSVLNAWIISPSGYVRRRRRELDKGVVQTSIPALQKGNPRLIIVDHMLLSR